MLSTIGIPATIIARPASITDYLRHPLAFCFPLSAALGLIAIRYFLAKRLELVSFLCSCGYLASMFLGAAFGLYPVLLPSVGKENRDITVQMAMSGAHTLRIGLIWWSIGICLAITYLVIVYRMFRGKVSADDTTYEH